MSIVHIVIGEADARKSSTLRCLTGHHGKGPLQQTIRIADATGNPFNAVVRFAALQERLDAFITPTHFLTIVRSLAAGVQSVIALRVTGTTFCPHSAADYLDAMLKAKFTVMNIALLGTVACTHQSAYVP